MQVSNEARQVCGSPGMVVAGCGRSGRLCSQLEVSRGCQEAQLERLHLGGLAGITSGGTEGLLLDVGIGPQLSVSQQAGARFADSRQTVECRRGLAPWLGLVRGWRCGVRST